MLKSHKNERRPGNSAISGVHEYETTYRTILGALNRLYGLRGVSDFRIFGIFYFLMDMEFRTWIWEGGDGVHHCGGGSRWRGAELGEGWAWAG